MIDILMRRLRDSAASRDKPTKYDVLLTPGESAAVLAEITRLRAALAQARDEGAGAMKAEVVAWVLAGAVQKRMDGDVASAERLETFAASIGNIPTTGAFEEAVADARAKAFKEGRRAGIEEANGYVLGAAWLERSLHFPEKAEVLEGYASGIRALAEKEADRG